MMELKPLPGLAPVGSAAESQPKPFPMKPMLATAALTLALFSGALWVVHHLFANAVVSAQQERQLHTNMARIMHLDEVLTMSAKMAAATGDRKWESRYRSFEPQLDATIKAVMAQAPEAFAGSHATDEANQALVSLEYQAFAWVRSGRRAQATALLAGQNYEAQKAVYAQGMAASVRAVERHSRAQAAKGKRMLVWLGGLALATLALLALLWIHIFRLIRQYLEIASESRRALIETNRNLEERVVARTAEILASKCKLEEEMQRRQAMEVELLRGQKLEAVGRLAAGIAHEINTPIQYIGDNCRFLQDAIDQLLKDYLGYIRTLTLGSLSREEINYIVAQADKIDLTYLQAEMPRAVAQSIEGVARVTEIVRALKEFAHPESKEKTASDLNKIIENAVLIARNEWKHEADMFLQFDRELPLVSCLAGDLGQVFLNLIVNAAHAIAEKRGDGISPKGTITIATHQLGDEVEVSVSDTGAGIPEAVQAHIFTPFFTTKGVGKGTGQGLAIAHNVVVEKHKGAIFFKSRIGTGTVFTVRLPLKASAVPAEPAARQIPSIN
jgi:signal transduction histidine kinase